MEENERHSSLKERGERLKNLTIVAMRATAALIIIGIGIFFLMYNTYFEGYEPNLINLFGYGCLAYGAFRIWRAFKDYQEV